MAFALIVIAALFFFAGAGTIQSSFKEDCTKLHKVIVDGKVYACELEKTE